MYIDGLAGKDNLGKNRVGYAITTQDIVKEQHKLPSHYSAQTAELTALIRALQLFENKNITIYTDSQYAYGALHHFCKQWHQRGFKTAAGKDVAHKALLQQLLEAVKLPKQVAVCKCAAHTSGTDPISTGNRLVDKSAKETAQILHSQLCEDDYDILQDYQSRAPETEKDKWQTKH